MQSIRKKSFAAEQLAKRQQKKPTLLILLVILGFIVIIGSAYVIKSRFLGVETPETEIKSIAVLAFKDMTTGKNLEHLGDGMAEAIINGLTQIDGFRVPGFTSALYFKDKNVKIQDIGNDLDVEYVLEGSIQESANKLRISAQLISVEDDTHLWSEQYDQFVIDDVFAIQDSIAFAIVEALKGKLLEEEKAAIEKRYTENTEAYELLLRAINLLNIGNPEGPNIIYQKSFDYINQALLKDPHFAPAYVLRAFMYMDLAWLGVMSPKEGWTKAREEAVKALQIDYSLAEVHVALATISFYYDWDWPAVERGFKKAFELNPDVSEANRYSEYLVTRGELNKALTYAKQALALDPLYIVPHYDVMNVLYCMGRYDEVIEHFHKAIDINPNNQLAYRVMGHLYLKQGKYNDALEAFEKIHEIVGEWIVTDEWIAYTYTRLGEKEKAEQILKKWLQQSRKEYVPSMPLASMYIGLEDYDNAFKYLDSAFEERDSHLVCIKYWPDFDHIRSDPRYKKLIDKMGLTEN